METQVTGAGILSFYWRVSSEAGWDFLEVYLDGTRQSRISGDTSWAQVTLNITGSGTHTIRWVYDKDGSVDRLSDTGWVDQVSWQGPPDALNLTAVTTVQTSRVHASATLSFTPAATGGSPAAIRPPAPQSSARKASLLAPSHGDVLATRLVFLPPEVRAGAGRLRQFHGSEEFRDDGLRLGTEENQQRLPDWIMACPAQLGGLYQRLYQYQERLQPSGWRQLRHSRGFPCHLPVRQCWLSSATSAFRTRWRC